MYVDTVSYLLFNLVLVSSALSSAINASAGSFNETGMFARSAPKIVNGVNTRRGQYPFTVALTKFRDGELRAWCGASIYDRNHVITAAHCLESRKLLILFGKRNLGQYEKGSTLRFVKSVTTHADYNPTTLENDIAIIELSGPLDFTDLIQPICLTDKRAKIREKVSVMGWGDTRGTADGSFLQVAQVRVINRRRCNRRNWYNGKVTEGMMCAGYQRGQTDSCAGDSGGPLVRETDDGFQLVGITSWGLGCAQRRKPGVYTDVFHYVDWIKANAGEPNYGDYQHNCIN